MTTSRRIAAALLTVLLTASAAPMAQDNKPVPTDSREQIALTPAEYNYVLGNMRLHLADVQTIVNALANDQPATAHEAATRLGSHYFDTNQKRPASLLAKLPPGFIHMSRTYHAQFDELANGISRGDPIAASLQRLSTAMQTCVGCHAVYSIAVRP
jgi:hypothetical protein